MKEDEKVKKKNRKIEKIYEGKKIQWERKKIQNRNEERIKERKKEWRKKR